MKQKKKMTSTGFLLLITIVLFFVMYAAGMVIFADKGFAKPQMFLNLFVQMQVFSVISCGLTIVMITGGIDISVGSVTALVCMVGRHYGKQRRECICGSSCSTSDRPCFWYRTGIPGNLHGNPAIYRNTCRHVLRTWYDSNHQYRHDLHQKRSIPEMGKLPFLHAIWFYKQKR